MKKVLSMSFILLFSFILVGCTNNSASNELVVGLECNYAPFNWTTPDSSETAIKIDQINAFCDGYDVEMATLIADELGRDLVIRKIEWDGLIPALLAGEIDVIIAGMSPTPERALTVSFTNEYYRSEQVFVVDVNSQFINATTLNDFEGAKVLAQLGTLQDGLIDQITNVDHLTALNDYPSIVQSVSSGVADALVAELPVAQSIVSSNDNLVIVNLGENGFVVDSTDVSVSVAVRQNDTGLLDSINEILNEITLETRNAMMNSALNRQP